MKKYREKSKVKDSRRKTPMFQGPKANENNKPPLLSQNGAPFPWAACIDRKWVRGGNEATRMQPHDAAKLSILNKRVPRRLLDEEDVAWLGDDEDMTGTEASDVEM